MARVIDSHQHFWDLQRFEYSWLSEDLGVLYQNYLPSDLKPLMGQAGVDATVIVQANQIVDETRWLLGLAAENDFLAGVVGWVDLTDEAVGDVLDEFADNKKLVGIRHVTHDEPDVDWQVRDDVKRGLGVLAKKGCTYDLLFRPPHLKHAATLGRAFPDLKLVIDHIAKPLIKDGAMDGWKDDMAAAAECENVYCKLSGMITEANWEHWKPADLKPFVDHVVDLFGFDRLMFGSDWPVALLAGSYQQVVDALKEVLGDLSESETEKVWGGTAAKFYGLD